MTKLCNYLLLHTEKFYGQEAILVNVKVEQGLTFTKMQSLLYIANL